MKKYLIIVTPVKYLIWFYAILIIEKNIKSKDLSQPLQALISIWDETNTGICLIGETLGSVTHE